MSSGNESTVYHIVAATFDQRDTAEQVASDFHDEQQIAEYRIRAHAVVDVDEKGKSHVHEPGHGAVGTTVGVVGGGLLTLLGGPLGLLAMAAAGGLVGGIVGRHFGRAISEDDLKELGNRLAPNTSAFLVLVEESDAERVSHRLQAYDTQILTMTVGDELCGELDDIFADEATST